MTDKNPFRPLIEVNVTDADWKEAVQYGGDLLVKAGKAEPRYVRAMIDNIEHCGYHYRLYS
ncbi:hypothetical protein GCM10010965_24580 [Caldalkalibacillus thermarum]|uniref:hypothetical protein n=1 Tax=Caldalkalibacillus thermarum TaxID=296745 RepID=UPI0016693612|nr:hypothetical protein [Caldalkalibacillus thermarum]GGK30851.1 hypothetical protein GCM10010965_24580 [Caldalkalibacillus thermarum]